MLSSHHECKLIDCMTCPGRSHRVLGCWSGAPTQRKGSASPVVNNYSLHSLERQCTPLQQYYLSCYRHSYNFPWTVLFSFGAFFFFGYMDFAERYKFHISHRNVHKSFPLREICRVCTSPCYGTLSQENPHVVPGQSHEHDAHFEPPAGPHFALVLHISRRLFHICLPYLLLMALCPHSYMIHNPRRQDLRQRYIPPSPPT